MIKYRDPIMSGTGEGSKTSECIKSKENLGHISIFIKRHSRLVGMFTCNKIQNFYHQKLKTEVYSMNNDKDANAIITKEH